jgi:hypothetical protein
MPPVVLFKGKGNIGADERQQYARGVHVIFTPKAVINIPSMNLYVKKWFEQVQEHSLSTEEERFPIEHADSVTIIINYLQTRIQNSFPILRISYII